MNKPPQSTPAGAPLPLAIALNWLCLFAIVNGLIGAYAVIMFAGKGMHGPYSAAMLFATAQGRQFLMRNEAIAALFAIFILAMDLWQRRKPRYRSPSLASTKRKGSRNFFLVIAFYLVFALSAVNPARIAWPALIGFVVLFVLSWQAYSKTVGLLPRAPELAVDPLAPTTQTEAPFLPTEPAAAPRYVQAGENRRRTAAIYLSQPNAHTVLVQRPVVARVLGSAMALFMLFGAGFVIWMLPHFRHTPPPMFYLMPPMCLFCCVMLLSEGSPSRLEIDTVGGTYRYSDYRRIGPNAKWGRTVLRWPFVYEHREGIVAEDFQGVGVRYPRGQNEFFYLRLPWKDENSGPITLAVVRSEAEARIMMHDQAAQLGIPQLGRLS